MSSMSTKDLSGNLINPRSRAMRTLLIIDRPSVATTLPASTAASAICCTRWMWLAKLAVMMRW